MNVRSLPARIRAGRLLSFREATMLAGVSEKRLRKDIEAAILGSPLVWRLPDSRLCFRWEAVIAISAVYRGRGLNSAMRRTALDRIHEWTGQIPPVNWGAFEIEDALANFDCPALVDIERPIAVNMEAVWRDIMPNLAAYMHGLERIEENPDILGGEAVFKGTRLSVYHVGKMVENGESVANILADYPYLDDADVDFAVMYCRAHPPVGRPRIEEEAGAGVKTRAG